MIHKRLVRPAMLATVAAFAIGAVGIVSADDTSGTAEVTGGTLTMAAPASHTFSGVTLDGTDQTITDSTLAIDVSDDTGSGSGWNVDITSTTFTNGDATPKTLSTEAAQVTAVASVCDAGTCTDPTNSISYPFTVPAGGTAPAAVKMFNAAADSGMGDFTVTPTITIDVPANSYAGTYTSTVTTTVSTGP